MQLPGFHRTLRSILVGNLVAGGAISLPLAPSVKAAPPATRPAIEPAPGAWKDKDVAVAFEVDLDEDGIPTPAESLYLVSRLEAAGASVRHFPYLDAKTTLLVIGRVVQPEGEALKDPIAVSKFEHYDTEVTELKAKAAALSIRVVTPDQIGNEFKLGRPTLQKLREVGLTRTLTQLSRRLPEVRFAQIGLSDALDFFSDVTGTQVFADRKAFSAAGLELTIPVTIQLRDVFFCTALGTLVDCVGSDKVTAVSDGTAIRLTTLQAAADLRKAEPGIWHDLTDLQPQTDPEAALSLRQAVKRRLPEVNFNGTELTDAIDFMRDVSGLNIYVSRPDLEAAKFTASAPVTLKRRNIATDQALAAIAADLSGGKLVFYCDRGEMVRLASKAKADAAVKADKSSYLLPVTE